MHIIGLSASSCFQYLQDSSAVDIAIACLKSLEQGVVSDPRPETIGGYACNQKSPFDGLICDWYLHASGRASPSEKNTFGTRACQEKNESCLRFLTSNIWSKEKIREIGNSFCNEDVEGSVCSFFIRHSGVASDADKVALFNKNCAVNDDRWEICPYLSVFAYKSCPADSQLTQLKAEADQLGEEQCKLEAPGCEDYQTYWKTGEVGVSGSSVTTDSEKAQGFGKLLIISAGQTFRGPVGADGWNSNYNTTSAQLEATESQLAFARFVKLKYNISTDFIVSTDNHQGLQLLNAMYPQGTRFISDAWTRTGRLNSAIKLARGDDGKGLDGYGAVFFIRPDLYLKPGFFTSFHLFDKLTFHYLERLASLTVYVSDMAFYVPKGEFSIFDENTVKLDSEQSFKTYNVNNKALMINTLHSHDTAITSNPLFRIVNRADGPAGESVPCEREYEEARPQSQLTQVEIKQI